MPAARISLPDTLATRRASGLPSGSTRLRKSSITFAYARRPTAEFLDGDKASGCCRPPGPASGGGAACRGAI